MAKPRKQTKPTKSAKPTKPTKPTKAKPTKAKPTKAKANAIRGFDECVAALRALGPLPAKKKAKKPAELRTQPDDRVDQVWSFLILSAVPDNHQVLENLVFVSDDKLRFESLAKLKDPESVLCSSLWSGIGAWNAQDDAAIWSGKKGEWIVVQAEFLRDDEESGCEVTFASWRVDGGLALFVTDLQHGYDRVAAVSGLALPDMEKWSDTRAWYGE